MFDWIGRQIADGWETLQGVILSPSPDPDLDEEAQAAIRKQAVTIWLIGKVQAGKSSIIRELAGSTDAEVGNGFRPCTRTTALFGFPPDAPILRFLDTRGFGEAGYDPAEDIATCLPEADLVMAVIRADDHATEGLRGVLKEVRAKNRKRPSSSRRPACINSTRIRRVTRMPIPGREPGSMTPTPRFPSDCAGHWQRSAHRSRWSPRRDSRASCRWISPCPRTICRRPASAGRH